MQATGRSAASPAAIRVWNLTKQFNDRTAVEDLTFEVPAGELFGFLGPNGAGKTTTIRILTGLLRPSAGRAEVAGIPLSPEGGAEIRRRVSVLSESPGLYLRLTVEENLEYFAGLYGWSGADAGRRTARALEAVGVADRRRDLAGALSKGLRQRVALARTLLNDPEILFLDEPTQGLDPSAARDVRRLIEQLRSEGVTVFLTTHRLEEAERLCDRVAFLKTRLRSVGRPEELRRRAFGTTVEVRLAAPLREPAVMFDAIRGIRSWSFEDGRYVVSVDEPRAVIPEIARVLVESGAQILGLQEIALSLEDVYLEVLEGPDEETPAVPSVTRRPR